MSRPRATSRKLRRVQVLLALFLVCLRTTQTARAFLGAGAVQFPRSVPPGIWAQNLLVARRAKADGTLDGGEAEDKEDVKGPLGPRDSKSKAPSEKDQVEEATTEAKASFDQGSRNKAVDEAASAQTADPVEDAKQDLLAARRERELALDGKQSAQKAVKELERFVAALREQWLQEFQSGNKKADEVLTKLQDQDAETKLEDAETKLKVAKQELNDAKQEYEQAKASAQAGPAQAPQLERAKASPAVQELAVKDFNISQCTRPEITVKPNQFVDLDQCVNRCVEAISKNLPKSTDGTTVRVPPVMLSRCMRGGKTTVLFYVFDRLQEQGKKPVFVSFNGDVAIDKVANEKPLVTLLRAIAVALMNQKSQRRENLSRLRCSEEALKAYLQDKTDVVLIIDELNVLLQPSATDDYAEVGAFLRREFLDRAGKHLIFSTHVPSSAGLDQLLGKGGGSSREAVAVAMPRSTQMPALRNMDNECSGLTICQAVFYGFIPSLIYSVQTQKTSFSIQGRFQAIRAPTLDAGVTKDFLTEFFTGRRCGDKRAIRAFDALTECPGEGEIRWILAYVGCMLSYLELGELSQWVEEIPVLAGQADSGMDWQAIVLIALALRCVQAKHVSAHRLLGLPAGAQPKEVYFYKIPPENCQQPDDVRSWWKKQKIEGYPYVAVLSPNYAKAAVFDVIWVYQRDPQSKQVFNGIQDKLGSATPNQNVPHWFENGFLFRGRAPEKDTTPRNRIGWTYKGAEDIRGFLGASLTAAYPANWP